MKTNRTVVGVDTAKRVGSQLHWVDMETARDRGFKADASAKFLERLRPISRTVALVAMEACGALASLGAAGFMIPGRVSGNKNQANFVSQAA